MQHAHAVDVDSNGADSNGDWVRNSGNDSNSELDVEEAAVLGALAAQGAVVQQPAASLAVTWALCGMPIYVRCVPYFGPNKNSLFLLCSLP